MDMQWDIAPTYGMRHWLAQQALDGMNGCRYVDVGALWGLEGETITTASRYTDDLTIIDLSDRLWPPMQERLQHAGVACNYLPLDVLFYEGEPFDVVFCSGVIYHFPDPELLWAKLWEITKQRLVVHTVVVPRCILDHGRVSFIDLTPEMRLKIESMWTPGKWVPPDSGTGLKYPYAAMQQIYAAGQLRAEAIKHGWRILFECNWGSGANDALICKK